MLKPWTTLDKVTSRIESFGAYALTNQFEYVEEGIPFLRCLNIKNGFVEFNDALYITPEAHTLLNKSEVKPDMVLLTMSGSVGNAAVALPDWEYPVNSNQDVAKITTAGKYSPYFFAAFLNGRFGQAQMERLPVGSVQQHVFLWMIEKLIVPDFSEPFQEKVEACMKKAYATSRSSISLYQQAEHILLHALGLDSWQPPEPLTYQRKASEAFIAGRLDSEYFSPRVQTLIAALSSQKHTVGDVVTLRKDHFSPAKQSFFEYIEISDVTASGEVNSSTVPSCEAPDRATWHVRKGDVITSTVRPIRRLSALIHPHQDGFVCSSGFAVLKPVEVPTELLLTYLRLPVIAELMDLHTTASLYPAISVPDILSIPFLKPADEVVEDIVQAVQQSHAARTEAQELLECAKRAVEVAIEENEKAAIHYLKLSKES